VRLTFSPWRVLAILALLPVGTSALSQQQPKKDLLEDKDTRVEPTHWGAVCGRVYDAATGSPIQNAVVTLETDEGFLDKGRSVGKTDELGGYRAQCILGRVSHNFDIGRALLTSGIGMLFGAANTTTKRIDASRVCMRVTADGHKTFEGVVIARGADASAFRLDMQPILLVPESTAGGSVAATGWAAVRIVAARAEPQVAHKGDTVKLVATIRAFGKNPQKNVELAASSRLWKGERRLNLRKEQGNPDGLEFELNYKVSGNEKNSAEIVYFRITRSVLDCNPDRASSAALVQIAKDTTQEQEAKQRGDGLDLVQQGKYGNAADIFKSLAGVVKPALCDLELLALTADRASNYDDAADAWQRMAMIKDVDVATGVAQRARALYLAKKYDQAAEAVKTELQEIKPSQWPRRIAPTAVGYLGLSLLKLNDVDRAVKLNEDLLEWPTSGLNSAVIEFRNGLRLAVVERANSANPNSSAALADYGRALLDLGRYEEAVAKLKQSLDVDPNQTAIRRDLAWAALQMHGQPPSSKALATAVAEAKVGLNLEKGKQRSKDFFSWNQYAILLYALADEQRAAGSSDAEATSDEAIKAFREALTLGRKGARTNAGNFDYYHGYTSGGEVAISGFAYPQANSSFVLLESLKKLRKDPADYLALFNESAALLDLGQPSLAERSISRLMEQKPDFTEGLFLYGLIQIRQGEPAKAEESLQKVLAANPLHPRANLVLAELLAKDGDMAGSAGCLAAHAKSYGEALSSQ
jgi:tetratricopeptide (TPR) repeat protein